MTSDPRASPSPWPSLVLTGAGMALLLMFGSAGACSIVATVLAIIFMLFLLRHLAFAVSASWTAPSDVDGDNGFDFGFRPSVSVLVPCRNEELVVEGLVACLLDLEYPHDL